MPAFSPSVSERPFELLNSGGEADLGCVGEVGLHGRPADDGTDAWRVWRLGFGGVVGCPEDFGQWVIDNIHDTKESIWYQTNKIL